MAWAPPHVAANASERVAGRETTACTATLYVNDEQVGQITGSTMSLSSLGNPPSNSLGEPQLPTEPLFKGKLGNLAFYRKALSA